MKNLKYRIYSVSSQSKQYPARNLMDSTDGWQSQISPTYPQQITIQFYIPIKTTSLKLTFHQYKIPKRVQVFVKASKIQRFRKLGYTIPHDNTQSSFQDKQIKTIYLQFPCSFIKLILHQNYKNQYNIFNQVAIEQLSVQGEILSHQQLKNLDLTQVQTDQQDNSQRQQNQQRLDLYGANQKNQSSLPLFIQIFRVLQNQKRQAVQRQDFQKASHLKGVMNNFKILQKQLKELEEEKKLAIEKEDFDKCHKLKIQINRKKQEVDFKINSLQENQSNYYSRVSQNQNPSIGFIQQTPQDFKTNRSHKKQFLKLNHDDQVVPAVKNKKHNLSNIHNNNSYLDAQFNSVSKINHSRQFYEDQNSQPFSAPQSNINSQTPQTTEKNQDLQPLDQKQFMKYRGYFEIIQQQDWKRVISIKKNWKTKQHALSNVLRDHGRIEDPLVFQACFQFLSLCFDDTNPSVVNSNLTLLQRLINSGIRITDQHLPYHIQQITEALVRMFIDTNQTKKSTAKRLFTELPEILPIHCLITILIKNKQKIKLDPRLLSSKLLIMDQLIQKYNQIIKSYDQIFQWAAPSIEDPNNQVRNCSSILLRRLYQTLDNQKLLSLLKNLKQSVRQAVCLNFQASRDYGFRQGSKIHGNDIYAYDAQLSKNDSLNFGNNSSKRSRQKQDKTLKSERNKSQLSSNLSKNQFIKGYSKLNLNNIGQSPVIPVPKGLKQSQQIDLAYSQQSMSERDNNSYFQSGLKNNQQYNQSENYWQGPDKNYISSENKIHVMEMNENQCDYCYEVFDCDQKTHLKQACTALITCQNCDAKIYIREMTEHLLDQCAKHLQNQTDHDSVKYYQQCSKCLLAFDISQINTHRALNNCVAARQKKQRCQFCAQDINPNDIAWAQHSKMCRQIPGRSFRNFR